MPFSAEHAIELIQRAQKLDRLAHAYLVSGPKEADLEAFAAQVLQVKTGSAAKALEDWAQDGASIIRPESKSRRITVKQIREMEQDIHMTSGPGGHKLGVIVDAERMNAQAQNAFLRTLEEPPPNTLFLLLTHQPQQLLTTILSRVIEITLLPPPGSRSFSDSEQELLAVLQQMSRKQSGSLASALSLKNGFQEVLEGLKSEIRKSHETEFKKEQDHYKKTTDGSWLKQREDQVEAMIASEYQGQRDGLMDLVLSWIGDVARQQVGSEFLELPAYSEATATLAERWSEDEVATRLRALRRLDRLLHTNVNEGLALEVSFVRAFA